MNDPEIQAVMAKIGTLDVALQDEARKLAYDTMHSVPVDARMPGIDTVLMAARESASGASAAASTKVDRSLGEPYGLPSFTMFQDPNTPADAESPWICWLPSVTVGETSLEVEEPGGYESGTTYYCHVFRDGSEWKAKIDSEPTTNDGDQDTRVSVKIAKLPADEADDPVEQYHVGTIHLNESGGIMASFSVYKADSGLTMFDPVVSCPPDTILTPSAPALGAGTYYCHVWRDGDWSYGASIDTSPSHSGDKSVLDVKICDITTDVDGNPVLDKQYHVGVICADARTGIQVKAGASMVTGGLGDGGADDVSRKVQFNFTEELLKNLAMKVEGEANGRDGATVKFDEDSSVETTIVTGLKELALVEGKLKLTVETAKIRIPIIEDSEDEAEVTMDVVTDVPVVTDSEYSESNGTFTNTMKKVTVLSSEDDADDEVFTAVKFPECPSQNDG